MKPSHGSMIYEGKAKRVFHGDKNDEVLIEFKNDATAFNALKKAQIEGKGRLNCLISSKIFSMLENNGISTHYLGLASDNWMIAKSVEIIPLEIVIRNIAFGSLCKQSPISPGTKLESPLLDFYYKDDNLADPLLTEARLKLLRLVSNDQRVEIEKLSMSVNDLLVAFFRELDLELVDFKLEIGLTKSGELLLADEISPDTCRIWNMRENDLKTRILDKDRFRNDLGGVIEAYSEIWRRIDAFSSQSNHYT